MFFKKIFDFRPLLLQKTIKETSIISFCNPKIRLLPGLRPAPRWGSLQRSPRLPSRLGRATLLRPLPLGAFGASTFKKRLRRLYYKSQGSAPPPTFLS